MKRGTSSRIFGSSRSTYALKAALIQRQPSQCCEIQCLTLNRLYKNKIILVRDERLAGPVTHLWVLLNACCLIPNTRLVHLRSDDLEQVEGIVDASSRETLDFLGCITALAGVRKSWVGELAGASRIDGAWTRRLGLRTRTFLRVCLRSSLLCTVSSLLLCQQ